MRADGDAGDVRSREAARGELRMQRDGGFHGGLRVELGGKADLEEDVLHDIQP